MTIETSRVISGRDPEREVELVTGMKVPKYFLIRVVDEPDIESDLEIRVVFDKELRRYVAHKISVTRRGAGSEVNNATLRELRIHDYVRRGLDEAFPEPPLSPPKHVADYIRSLGPSSSQALAAIARVYAYAQAVNERPAKAVQTAFGLSAPTASVWIRRAKDLRFIATDKPIPSPDALANEFESASDILGRLT